MLKLLSLHPTFEYLWSVPRRTPDAEGGFFVEFGCVIRYEEDFQLRAITPPNIFRVPALTVSDVEVFSHFHRALEAAVEMCRAPMMKRWENVIREPSFRAAETDVINSPSMHAALLDGAIEIVAADHRYVLYRQSFWLAEAPDFSLIEWLSFFEEFGRREALGLPRLSPGEYFHVLSDKRQTRPSTELL